MRQRKGQQFEGNEEHDYAIDPKTDWRFHKGVAGETCRQLRQGRQSGTEAIGRRAIGILSTLQALIGETFFSE